MSDTAKLFFFPDDFKSANELSDFYKQTFDMVRSKIESKELNLLAKCPHIKRTFANKVLAVKHTGSTNVQLVFTQNGIKSNRKGEACQNFTLENYKYVENYIQDDKSECFRVRIVFQLDNQDFYIFHFFMHEDGYEDCDDDSMESKKSQKIKDKIYEQSKLGRSPIIEHQEDLSSYERMQLLQKKFKAEYESPLKQMQENTNPISQYQSQKQMNQPLNEKNILNNSLHEVTNQTASLWQTKYEGLLSELKQKEDKIKSQMINILQLNQEMDEKNCKIKELENKIEVLEEKVSNLPDIPEQPASINDYEETISHLKQQLNVKDTQIYTLQQLNDDQSDKITTLLIEKHKMDIDILKRNLKRPKNEN